MLSPWAWLRWPKQVSSMAAQQASVWELIGRAGEIVFLPRPCLILPTDRFCSNPGPHLSWVTPVGSRSLYHCEPHLQARQSAFLLRLP